MIYHFSTPFHLYPSLLLFAIRCCCCCFLSLNLCILYFKYVHFYKSYVFHNVTLYLYNFHVLDPMEDQRCHVGIAEYGPSSRCCFYTENKINQSINQSINRTILWIFMSFFMALIFKYKLFLSVLTCYFV